ncbi:MAG: ABC transporter permease [Candidatus Aenigmarchaeota archaeon]|nr:ABC transporter permease [Candidatus Aenigmarchaeota archaeon]
MLGIWKIIIRNLSYQKLRTALTLLGIVIGVGAIVSMITLGDALENSINEQFEQMGTDKIMIMPGAPNSMGFSGAAFGTEKLTESDLKVVKRVNGVETAFGILSRTAKFEFGKEEAYTMLYGMDVDISGDLFSDVQGYEIEYGRDLRGKDKYAAVFGYLAKSELFDREVKVRDRMEINGKTFKVVGLLKKIGNPMDDMSIMIPIEAAKSIFNDTDEFSMIFVDARDDIDVDKVSEKIKDELEDARGAEDFKVQTFGDMLEMATDILNILQIVFIGIAAISLLVGGIGIMNIMLMTVLERTKEIGIMKATGATNKIVSLLFLGEAAIVGFLGGLIGFGIGFSGSYIVAQLAGNTVGIPMNVYFSPELLVGSLVFSIVIGMVSGAYPARKAAKMDPVDALRYE